MMMFLISTLGYAATKDVIPRATSEGNIGTSAKIWGGGYFSTINVGGQTVCLADGTNCPGSVTSQTRYDNITTPLTTSGINSGAFHHTWTSTTGTNLWTAAVTAGDYFKVVNSGNLTSGGSIIKIVNTGNSTGGSVFEITNTDTDMMTITAPNFTLTQAGILGVPTITLSGTGTLNELDAIDSTTETTLESAIDIAGDVDGTGLASVDLDETAVETELESVLDLDALQGAVTDAQVPDTITISLAATATALAANGANCSAGSYPLGVDASGVAESCTVESTGGSADSIAYHKITPPLTSHGINFGAFNNTWTNTTGTHVFTAAATSGEFFTVANSGVLASGGALLRLNQSVSANPTGGSIISIENYDTDVAHVTAPNFTVSQAGLLSVPTVTLTGTGTLNGLDSIDSTTETTLEGAIDIAGDVSGTGLTAVAIGADKVTEAMLKAVDSATDEDILTFETTTGDFEWHTCAQITGSADLCDGSDATGGAGGSSTINNIGDAEADGAIYMGAFSSTWTSTTGSHIWTGASTGGEYFKIVNSGAMVADTGILKVMNTGAATNGSVLEIVNTDTDMRSIKAPNFTLSQAGNVTMSGDLTVSGDDLYMATNTSGAALIADGTNFNPVAISGDATISSTGVVAIQANSVALTTDTVGDYATSNAEGGQALGMDYNYLKSPTGNSGVSFAAFNNTWTATTGTNVWTSANTAGDAFKMVNSGALGTNTSILKVTNTGSVTGGSVLQIENTDTDMQSIRTPNLIVRQAGNTTIGSLGAVNLAKLGVDGDADENQLLVQGNATQTTDIVVVENSAGTNVWTASTAGSGFSVPVTVSGGLSFAIQSTIDNAGWSIVDGTDNTAGTAQCTSACMFGIQNATGTAVTGLVGCSDTSADSAACMGNN